MTALIGNYQLEKNENIDEYFKAIGKKIFFTELSDLFITKIIL